MSTIPDIETPECKVRSGGEHYDVILIQVQVATALYNPVLAYDSIESITDHDDVESRRIVGDMDG